MERKQSMFRIKKDNENPYVMINKGFLNDENLSLKAKGLLAYLLSLPDDWQIYENEIIKHHKDGKDSLKSAIKELIENEYIERTRTRDEKGRLGAYEYRVYEVSIHNGKSYVGKTNVGKSATTNNKKTNNKKTNNKYLHHLDELNDAYIFSYLNIMKQYGHKHKRISDENMNYIEYALDEIKSYDIDLKTWEQEVHDHFGKLAKGRDGDILLFLKACRRHFEVDLEEL